MESNKVKIENFPFHIAVVPWLAHGHIMPLLDLSMKFCQRDLKVTIISTPMNASSMEKLIEEQDQTYNNAIEFKTIELPKVEGLPEGKENTRDLEGHQVGFLIEAVENMQEPLRNALLSISPDCVVCDMFVPVSPAKDLGIPLVVFVVTPALPVCHTWEGNPDVTKLPFSPIYEGCFSQGPSPAFYKIQSMFHGYRTVCDGIICNSCTEVEGKFITHLQKLVGKPVFAVGPLSLKTTSRVEDESEDVKECMTWMDRQSKNSVLYIAFGSQCFLSKEETKEIALGLEESGVLFVWALRRFSDGDERNKLPDGFEGRIKEKKSGFILGGWVPQKKLLEKDCVGGFMSHCGSSSLLEGMQLGMPFVALPLMFDQGVNARLVTGDLGLGLEVRRDSEGVIRSEEVSRCIKGVIGGEGFKKKAEDLRDVFRTQILAPLHGSQARNMGNFVNFLRGFSSSSGIKVQDSNK